MSAFTENKKKASSNTFAKRRDTKLSDKSQGKQKEESSGWASSSTSQSVKPAWHDAGVDNMQVRIEDTSRLRKLKRDEGEQEISGD